MKKKLNIPVCDVTEDPEYDTRIKADFQLPATFIRHSRKLVDEIDLSTDYVADVDDEVRCLKHFNSSL